MLLVPPPSFAEYTLTPKLVLLDRDGVINRDVGAPGVLHSSQLELTPNAGHAIARLRQIGGCSIAMVTNQSCVGKGLISDDELEGIQSTLQEMLLDQNGSADIDKVYSCTSRAEADDPRMKPRPGMIEEAISDFDVIPSECCLIGDSLTDLQAAAAAGISNRILVSTGYGRDLMDDPPISTPAFIENWELYPKMEFSTFPFVYCDDLCQASEWLLHRID